MILLVGALLLAVAAFWTPAARGAKHLGWLAFALFLFTVLLGAASGIDIRTD